MAPSCFLRGNDFTWDCTLAIWIFTPENKNIFGSFFSKSGEMFQETQLISSLVTIVTRLFLCHEYLDSGPPIDRGQASPEWQIWKVLTNVMGCGNIWFSSPPRKCPGRFQTPRCTITLKLKYKFQLSGLGIGLVLCPVWTAEPKLWPEEADVTRHLENIAESATYVDFCLNKTNSVPTRHNAEHIKVGSTSDVNMDALTGACGQEEVS